ncbi:Ger(x)C family spore germination protein [Desulfosporosinus sp.]|uniref:Ger(x)C family spore germination protein n=1 Tax=Desulfosporosinus sp. TaxID=157907 RepID=UPI00230CAEFA|nr:Ger(x)C family spore germination protein [Desulfosporosinus sp.]MCO5387496.1 Ger(x)C family spore germination protein [Desulfosporosinus sp.]MDA8221969.1 Ger(x)C family spore germination protein [Desulfitobacterium hafniense]
MKIIRITLLALIILIISTVTTGCWNYREVDKMSIVAGVAVDKGQKDKFQITVEIIQISAGKDTNMTSKTITMEGKTMFDAARNIISISGKRLYWSHAKVIILSKEIASQGVTEVIEWYNRDSETREDVRILISEGTSAKEVFDGQGSTDDIKSFVLEEMIKNQVSLSKAPMIDILKLNIESKTQGISTIIPTVNLLKRDGKMYPQIMGTAIIKNDKLVGFLDGEETKDLTFIRDEVKGGVLIEEMQANDEHTLVSLEIFKSKTKVTPVSDEQDIEINLNIDTTVAIDEINGSETIFNEEGRRELEESAENTLKERIESLIKKIQSEYNADIFGFGAKLRENDAQVWNDVGNNWDEVFKDLKVNVQTTVHIKNSAMLSKSSKEGD